MNGSMDEHIAVWTKVRKGRAYTGFVPVAVAGKGAVVGSRVCGGHFHPGGE